MSETGVVVRAGDVVEGRYRILKTLGEGGMGTVFLAEHALIKRRVALKVLHPELATDADVVARFMNEARAAGTLGHPNIVESTDMGFVAQQVPYIVFEYLEGTLLTDEIYRVGGLGVRRTIRIAQQIASALHAAHVADIVHRDLKSDNVFLTDKDDMLDHVKVIDFGISRFLDADDEATRRGVVMGTPEFMAPEQITAPQHVDRRTDIYALGVIMYEMLTARRPYATEEDPQLLLHRIVHEEPQPLARPEVPHALNELIFERLLAKSPDDRFATMVDVVAALDAFTTHGGVKRRSQPIAIPAIPSSPSIPSGADIAQSTDLIPRAKHVLDTPYPGIQIEAARAPATPRGKSWMLYGVAGAGVVVGALGLVIGLRGESSAVTASMEPAPPPVQQVQPAPRPAAAAPVDRKAAQVEVRFASTARNARVTFRRRVAAAPFTVRVTPSDIVELVEVSAPGKKTMRYWLTLDRPTTLNADLTAGEGLTEASEEQTLVALGEVAAAPAAPRVETAAAAPAVGVTQAQPKLARESAAGAPRSGTPESRPDEHAEDDRRGDRSSGRGARKIGRGSAEAQQQPPMMPELSAEAVVEKPLPEAEPTPTQSHELAAPQPIELPKPPPAPELISAATLAGVVGDHRGEVLACFAEGKQRNHALHGTVTVQFSVDQAGVVRRAQVQSTLGDAQVAACVAKVARAWRFPAREVGGTADVSYPFHLN